MNISILTPHHDQISYLQRCAASIQNQIQNQDGRPDFCITHYVQDSGNTDLSAEAIESLLFPSAPMSGYCLDVKSSPDDGMYDALNKAYERSGGDLIGHLNCDEQYLPGTLDYVRRRFEEDPDLEVLSGAVVITYPDGSYCCSRLPVKPGKWHTQVCHLSLLTAATFYRRTLIKKLGGFFDTSYKAAGDAEFFTRILKAGATLDVTHRYFASFTEIGTNLALSDMAREEKKRRLREAPWLAVKLRPLFAAWHQIRKLLQGCYHPKPFDYTWINDELDLSVVPVAHPRAIWRDRHHPPMGPHNGITSAPPADIRSRNKSIPHLLVVSPPRCGTHLMIDAILNNLPAYRRRPLYVELDRLTADPAQLQTLQETGGYVIKSHHPIAVPHNGPDLSPEVVESLSASSIVIRLHRDSESAFRSASQMFPGLSKETFLKGIRNQDSVWASFESFKVDFQELLDPRLLNQLISRIADQAGVKRSRRLILSPPKSRRRFIYCLKAMTRLLGPWSPRINTGIRLGDS